MCVSPVRGRVRSPHTSDACLPPCCLSAIRHRSMLLRSLADAVNVRSAVLFCCVAAQPPPFSVHFPLFHSRSGQYRRPQRGDHGTFAPSRKSQC